MSAAFEALLVRRRLILATTALLALTGLGSWLTMPREEDPQFPHRDGSLVTVFPGADALTVERLVLEPIEEHLAEVEQIDNIFSTARSGVVVQHIELHDGVYDTDTAWDDVRAAIDAARDEFPAGVLEPDLDDDLVSQEAIVYALVGSADPLVLVDAAERVKRELVSIRTVKRVNLLAEPGEQVIVEYDDATARRLGVDPERLGAQLGARSRIVPGGMVHLGDKAVTLRPQTEMRTLEEIRATPVLLASGASVPLSELARVRLAPAEPAAEIMRWNGEPAVGLGVVPQDGLDRVALGAEVRERVVGLEAELAPVRLEEVTFQPDLVSDRLSELTGSLRLGIFIVALILFVAMGPRLGLVVAMVVPLVTFGSMALFAGAGGILHQVSIAALVIALGMLVDNAIVMAENIQYRLDRGMPAAAAAAASVRELAAPLGTATATTLAAFVPMLVSKGATADFTRSIPTLIMLTLAVSYVFAVLVTPVLSELILRPRRVSPSDAGSEDADGVVDGGMDDRLAAADKEGAARRLGTAAEAVDGDLDTAVVVDPDAEHSAAMGERSLRLARWIHGLALGRPGWVLAGAVALLALSFFAIRWVDFKFFPAADRPTVVVDLDMPEGSHLETTDAAARSLERALLEHPDVASVATFVGRSGPKFYYNLRTRPASPHRASLIAEARSIDAVPDLIAWTREIVARDLPAASLVARRLEQGPPIDAPLEVRVRGHDLGDMEQVADRLLAAMREVEGTRDVRHDLGLGVPIMRFEIDDAAAARHGLSRADVGRVLSGRTLGAEIGQYRGGNDPAPILVRSAAGEEMTPDELTTLALPTAAGGSVPLAEVAELEVDWQPAAIYHRNRSRVVTVQAQLVPGVTALDSYRAIEPTLNALELPPGVTIELGGELEESGEANAAILRQIPVGMLLLLFFLLLEFDSFRRVAIILTTVPLAAVGVVPGLILSGQPFGMMSLLGVISLIGIVVNNAIVLLDVIEQRRSDGGTVGQALAEAVERRTRPILLTMATTVAGLSPLAFSEATLWPPLAWAMISGLAASTVLTLLVVPALYRVLFDDRASGERGATRRGLASRLGFGRSRSLATATAMLVALVGGLVMADRAGAQEPPLRLDLDAAMERAASRPVARAAAAGAAAAEQAAEAERRLGRRPTVALELEGVVRDEAFSFETPIGPFQLGEADSVTAALSVSQPLFDRPQNRFRTPAAAMEARAQDDVARRTRERLRAEAAERFLDVLALDASSAATGAFVESLEARLDEMTQRVELGRALEADALKVELDLDAARLDRDRLAARRVVAVEALARAVGHDGPVVPLSAPAASSAADSVLDAAAREAIVSEALAQRADLAALEAEAKAFELRALAVQAERWPTVRAAAAYLDSSGEAFFPEEEVRATLTFAFVPFAAGTRAPRAAALEAQADSARLRADAARRDVRFEIERAVADLDIAHRTLRVRERGVDLATETARVERERSLAGRSTTNDLLAAEAALRSQRTARDLARLDIIRAEVALDLATGRPAESAPRGSAALDQRGVH